MQGIVGLCGNICVNRVGIDLLYIFMSAEKHGRVIGRNKFSPTLTWPKVLRNAPSQCSIGFYSSSDACMRKTNLFQVGLSKAVCSVSHPCERSLCLHS